MNANEYKLMNTLIRTIKSNDQGTVTKLLASGSIKYFRRHAISQELLNCAIKYDHKETVLTLLANGSIVDDFVYHFDYLYKLLNWVVINGHQEIVTRLLLAMDDDVNRYRFGSHALLSAAENGHKETFLTLLSNNAANINHVNQDGENALLLAAENGHIEVVKLLIDKGANINRVNKDGKNALLLAAENGHIEVVKLLIDKGANLSNLNKLNKINIFFANKISHNKTFILIKDFFNNQKINSKITPLVVKQIKNIYDSGNEKNIAEIKIMDLLKEYKLKLASKFNNENLIVNLLFKNFINNLKFEHNQYSILHLSAVSNMKKLTKYLVDEGIDIDYKDTDNMSAWNHACIGLNIKIAFLIKNPNHLTPEDLIFLNDFLDLPSVELFNDFKNEENEWHKKSQKRICIVKQIDEVAEDSLEFFKISASTNNNSKISLNINQVNDEIDLPHSKELKERINSNDLSNQHSTRKNIRRNGM